MARLPAIKRLSTEDFKDQSAWISKLLSPLNEFMSSVVSALNGQLTFGQNMNAQVKEIEFTVQATGTYPLKFQATTKTKPIGLWVVNCIEIDNANIPTGPIFAAWEHVNGEIRIQNVSGLTTGRKYRLTVILIGS